MSSSSDSSSSHQSRFAELAMELMGSRAAAQLIQEVWVEASPEVKKDLADKLLIAIRDWAGRERSFGGTNASALAADVVQAHASSIAQELMVPELPALRAKIEVAVRQALDLIIPGVLGKIKFRVEVTSSYF